MTNTIDVTDGPAIVTIRPYVGDTLTRTVTVKVDGALVTITADDFKMRFENARTGEEIVTLEVGSGITFGTQGKLTWKVTPTQLADFPLDADYRADLQWTRASDDNVKTLVRYKGRAWKDITPA